MIREDMVIQAVNEAQFAYSGSNLNESYQEGIKHIRNNQSLNEKEKERAISYVTRYKDHYNYFTLKEDTYPCEICGREGFTILQCEHCVRDALEKNFASWTSGNDIIDNAIQETQTKCPIPGKLTEWIPYKDLANVRFLTQGGCANIWTATWKKGYFKSFDKEHRQLVRGGPDRVVLKQLANSKNATEEYLKEVIF